MEKGLSFSPSIFPRTPDRQKLTKVPLIAYFDPFNDNIQIQNSQLNKCSKCGAFLFADAKQPKISCQFCNQINSFPDFSLPGSYEWNTGNVDQIITLILIDSTSISRASNFFQAVVDLLPSSLPPDLTNFAIASFSRELNFVTPNHLYSIPAFEDIEISPSFYYNYIPESIKHLNKSKAGDADLLSVLNFAQSVVGNHGRIIVFLSSTPKGFVTGNESLKLEHFISSNFNVEWSKLLTSLKKRNITVDMMINMPLLKYIDTKPLIKLVSELNGNFEVLCDVFIHNELKKRLPLFLNSFVASITFTFPSYLSIKGQSSKNGINQYIQVVNSNQAITIVMEIKSIAQEMIPFQAVVRYVNRKGERMIRVFTKYVKASDDLNGIHYSINSRIMLKQISNICIDAFDSNDNLEFIKNQALESIILLIKCFKSNSNNSLNRNELIIPKSISELPMNILGLLKSSVFAHGTYDTIRAYQMWKLRYLTCEEIRYLVDPTLYDITDFLMFGESNFSKLPLMCLNLQPNRVYALYDVFSTSIYVGELIDCEFRRQFLKPDELYETLIEESEIGQRLIQIINGSYRICFEDGLGDNYFLQRMIVDRGEIESYQQWISLLIQKVNSYMY